MSFGSEPGRDDGGPPPANIVIPDDARELARDVLAYRREQRARRRREWLMRLLRPARWRDPFLRHDPGRGDDPGEHGLGGHGAILPLIATCVALSMLAGAMLSVITITPASAPTVPRNARHPASSCAPTPAPATDRDSQRRNPPRRNPPRQGGNPPGIVSTACSGPAGHRAPHGSTFPLPSHTPRRHQP
ncbi:MAG: hypothetical protein J2P25_01575 [Nocardiopsaceae bacterium]|nr:hypothetical protein [Nocardiopsaceae bacterium]